MDETLAALAQRSWYYTVELEPGLIARGYYPDILPMLPRVLMRGADLRDAECLDLGSMEGLIPVLMRRGGASRVVATDAKRHCQAKMAGVKRAYGVDFDFVQVGLMYDLARRWADAGAFDLINVSGLLYHVFSPMHVIAGVRPLLKRNGLMIVSTNVICRDDCTMTFNARGKLQTEYNTYWYHSVPALEELMRYFNLKPLDALYTPLSVVDGHPAGLISVICRAVEEEETANLDPWTAGDHRVAWEYQGLVDRQKMDGQPVSAIAYARDGVADPLGGRPLLDAALSGAHTMATAERLADTHALHLADLD